ncbi:MAG: hypothetical protein RKU31_40210 [Deltaproteobacteria bacterium]|jgi:cytochrome c oxidase subunit 2
MKIRNMRHLAAIPAGLVVWATSAVAMAAPKAWEAPHDASEHGHNIDWLINITNLFSAVLFAIMCFIMISAFIKHGKKHSAEYDTGDGKNAVMMAMAISAVIFVIVDGNLFVNSTKDVFGTFWNFEKVDKDPQTLKVEVQGRQWMWQMRLAGKDGKFNTSDDALSDHELVVPVNTPVLLQLASPDVIHTFALPHFRIKQDAMPGMINLMWFQGKEEGEFPIVCVQNCGANHYQMAGTLKVVSKEAFDEWVELKVRDSEAVWDEKDAEAHWGWAWKKI